MGFYNFFVNIFSSLRLRRTLKSPLISRILSLYISTERVARGHEVSIITKFRVYFPLFGDSSSILETI